MTKVTKKVLSKIMLNMSYLAFFYASYMLVIYIILISSAITNIGFSDSFFSNDSLSQFLIIFVSYLATFILRFFSKKIYKEEYLNTPVVLGQTINQASPVEKDYLHIVSMAKIIIIMHVVGGYIIFPIWLNLSNYVDKYSSGALFGGGIAVFGRITLFTIVSFILSMSISAYLSTKDKQSPNKKTSKFVKFIYILVVYLILGALYYWKFFI